MENKRLNYIDIAKGIGVLLVIFGHTFRESMRADYYWCDFSYLFVYRFHVSLLFLLSGMGYALTREKNLQCRTGVYLKKKAKTLLLPWFTYSVIIYAVFGILQMIPQTKGILAGSSYEWIAPVEFFAKLIRNENPYSFHVWYLQTLFLFVVVIYLIDCFLNERSAKYVKVLLLLLMPIIYELFCTDFCWTVKGFAQKLFFFLLGTFITDRLMRENVKKLILAGGIGGVFVLVMVISPAAQKLYEIPYAGLAVSYLETIMIAAFCLGIIAVCVVLEKRWKKLGNFGKHTMSYYLYHQPFCGAFLGIVLYEKLGLPAIVTVIFCMGASLILPYLVTVIIKKARLEKLCNKIGLPT